MGADTESPILGFCYPAAEAKIVEASLSLEGFMSFDDPDSDKEPDPGTRYLKKTIISRVPPQVRRVNPNGTISVLWDVVGEGVSRVVEEIDPYTGLMCRTGQTAVSEGASDLQDMTVVSTTRKEGEPEVVDQCGKVNSVTSSIQLSDTYTLSEVAANVTDLVNTHFDNIYHYNVKGTVVTGSDGDSVVAMEPAGQVWEAKYVVNGDTVTKSAIEVKFNTKMNYTTTDHRGRKDVFEANEGDIVRFDPPTNEGEVIQIHACQALFQCLVPRATVDYKSVGYAVTYKPPEKEEGAPECEYPYYLSGKGERYKNLKTYSTTSHRTSVSADGGDTYREGDEEYTISYGNSATYEVDSDYTSYGGCDSPDNTENDEQSAECYSMFDGIESYGSLDEGSLWSNCYWSGYVPSLPPGTGDCGCTKVDDMPDELGHTGAWGVTLHAASPVTGTPTTRSTICENAKRTRTVEVDLSAEETHNVSGSFDEYSSYSFEWTDTLSITSSRTQTETLINKEGDPYDKGIASGGTEETENVEDIYCTGWSGNETAGVETDIVLATFLVESQAPAPIPGARYVTVLSYLKIEMDESDPDCPKLRVEAKTEVGDTQELDPRQPPVWQDLHSAVRPIPAEKKVEKCIEYINAYVATSV